MGGIISIFLIVAGLIILYLVIYNAVRDGINKSIVGQYIESELKFTNHQKSPTNNDFDQD